MFRKLNFYLTIEPLFLGYCYCREESNKYYNILKFITNVNKIFLKIKENGTKINSEC